MVQAKARNSIHVYHVSGRNPSIWTVTCCLWVYQQGPGWEVEAGLDPRLRAMRCRNPQQYLTCHTATPEFLLRHLVGLTMCASGHTELYCVSLSVSLLPRVLCWPQVFKSQARKESQTDLMHEMMTTMIHLFSPVFVTLELPPPCKGTQALEKPSISYGWLTLSSTLVPQFLVIGEERVRGQLTSHLIPSATHLSHLIPTSSHLMAHSCKMKDKFRSSVGVPGVINPVLSEATEKH